LNNLLAEAEWLRKEHPGCGVEKMYYTLCPDFIGRDQFIEVFMELGFRVKRNKNYRRTTYSIKNEYPNLIKGLSVAAPSTVWQSDITYMEVGDRFYYAVFIIDVYTKKVVGYNVSDNMRATANLKALRMALRNHPAPKIHHSDRGSQYIYHEYTEMLKGKGSQISMSRTAQDNAYAERINETIKYEYLKYWKPKSYKELERCVKKAVNHYNKQRPHNRLMRMTPESFEHSWLSGAFSDPPIEKIYNHPESIN
jgi:transposase InsO family protein